MTQSQNFIIAQNAEHGYVCTNRLMTRAEALERLYCDPSMTMFEVVPVGISQELLKDFVVPDYLKEHTK